MIDYAARWSVYDLDSKKLIGEVLVQGLKEVKHAFLLRCSNRGSFFLYIFMDGSRLGLELECSDIYYAKVRLLQTGVQNFAAIV